MAPEDREREVAARSAPIDPGAEAPPELASASDEALMDAALQVVAERGYFGASTRRIAQAAGVNEVTLFRRFSTKQALVTRAVAREAGRVIARLAPTGDLQADLVAACQVYRDLLVERAPFIAVLVSEVPRHPELASVLRGPLDVLGAVAGIIARAQEAGRLEPEPPIHATLTLLAPLLGLALLGRTAAVSLPPLDLDLHVRRFIRGRTPRGKAAQEEA